MPQELARKPGSVWIPDHKNEIYLEIALNERCWARAMLDALR